MAVGAQAQAPESPQYVVLYAHSYGNQQILDALPQSTGEKTADISKGATFRLSPVLGHDLQIHGSLTFNLYLRASGAIVGNVSVQLTELTKEGTETAVPGVEVDTQVSLNTAMTPVILGVGPIDYKFHASSAILLQVGIVQSSGTGKPFLVWDDPSALTSVKLPTIAPATADIRYFGQGKFGRIFQANPNGTQTILVNVTLTDSIGVYRFNSALIRLTAQNGTSVDTPMNSEKITAYSTAYTITSSFDQGKWQVGLLLHDSSGNLYSFTEAFWVATFYPVLMLVTDCSSGSVIQNATLTAWVSNESIWKSVTNASGWVSLSLPSALVVGPLNLTLSWRGTQSLFPLEVTGPSTLAMWCPVYITNIRITLAGIPLPFARATLLRFGEVQQVETGLDGTARFGGLPRGNYTLRVEYLLAVYQTSFLVSENGMVTVPVPFPQWLIIVGIAIIVFALVVLIRRKRKKNHDPQETHSAPFAFSQTTSPVESLHWHCMLLCLARDF